MAKSPTATGSTSSQEDETPRYPQHEGIVSSGSDPVESYGSLTLEGAVSLSSDDTFQNSPDRPKQGVPSPRIHDPPTIGSPPPNRSILKQEKDNGEDTRVTPSQWTPVLRTQTSPQERQSSSPSKGTHSIQRVQKQKHGNDVDEWSSSSEDDFNQSLTKRKVAVASKNKITSRPKPKKHPPKKHPPKNKSPPKKHPPRNNNYDKSSPQKLAVPILSPRKPTKKVTSSQQKPSNSTTSFQSSLFSESNSDVWKDPLGTKKEVETPKQDQKNAGSKNSAWTGSFSDSKGQDNDWANDCLDLAAWRSDDDSSFDFDDKKSSTKPSKKPRENRLVSPTKKNKSDWKSPLDFGDDVDDDGAPSTLPAPDKTTRDGKPRSAYDKNAEWYCGDDDNSGSMTDGSSVLSAFRPTKKKQQLEPDNPPKSEASMDFGALLGEEGGSSEALRTDESMGLNFLQNKSVKDQPLGSTKETILDLEEESLKSVSVRDLLNGSFEMEGAKQNHPKEKSSSNSENSENDDSSASSRETSQSQVISTENTKTLDKNSKKWASRVLSRKALYWILFGVMLMLIMDIVLLSVFLTRRNKATAISYVPETICLDWIPGSGLKSSLCPASETEKGGGVPNLLAQAIKSSSPKPVDVSLIPAGLSHSDIPQGDFTEDTARAVTTKPPAGETRGRILRRSLFDVPATLVFADATGLQIRQILSQSVEAALDEGDGGFYPYAAGLRFSVDASSVTDRVNSVQFQIDDTWIEIDDIQEYTIITTQDWLSKYLQTTGTTVGITTLRRFGELCNMLETLTTPEFSTINFVDKSDSGNETDTPGLATVPSNICLEWVPGQGVSNICSKEATSKQGGGVANVVASAVLDHLQATNNDIDIFLLNAGDCQVDMEEGLFKEDDSRVLLPFDHPLVFLELTGQQLMDSLEQAIDFALASALNRGSYPYAGGLRFEVRAAEKLGSRVSNVEYFTRGRWKAMTRERQYKLATTLPLADGEKGYDDLFYALVRTDPDGLTLRDSFIEFVKRKGTIEDVPLDKYSTQDYVA